MKLILNIRYAVGFCMGILGVAVFCTPAQAEKADQPPLTTELSPLPLPPPSPYRDVSLDEFTNLTLYIAPLLGTRLSFPVVLDNNNDSIPFTLDLTNAGLFQITRHEGRNFFLISAPMSIPADDQGSLFVQVAGRFISIRLAIGSPYQHVDEVRFHFSDKHRSYLLQASITKERERLRDSYDRKMAEFETDACQSHRELLALIESDDLTTRAIYLKKEFALGTVYIDKVIDYGIQKNLVIEAAFQNPIESLRLHGLNLSGSDEPLSSNFICRNEEATQRCSIRLTDRFLLENYPVLFLTVQSNEKMYEVPW